MLALFCKWLFWVVGAAILGFVLAWLMRGAKANEWRTQFEDRDASYKRVKSNHQGLVSKYETLERSSNKLRNTNTTLKKDVSTKESEISKLMQKLKAVPAAAATAAVVSNGSSDNSYEIRAWESKYARLERELATKTEMFDELKEDNEMLNTKMEVLALTTEDAKKEKESALGKLKQYEEYRPRFEEANLERNTLKYKYEQLLASRTAVQTTQEDTNNQTEALTSEINTLKATIASANEQAAAQKSQIETLTDQNKEALNSQKDIKIKYDSLLGLQERTEVKMKELEQQAAASTATPADVKAKAEELESYKSRLDTLSKENDTLKGSLEEAKAQAKANDSTAEIANWADKHKSLSEENNRLKTELEESKLTAAQNAAPATNEYEQKWNALKQEETNWTNKHNNLSKENEELKAALQAAQNTAPATNEYEQKWNALRQEETNWTTKHNALSKENEELKDALEEKLTIERKAAKATNEYEQKWTILNEENKQLKAALEESKATKVQYAAANMATPASNEYEQKWNALKQEEASWITQKQNLEAEIERLKAAKKPASKASSKAEKAAKAEAAKGQLASAIGTKIKVAKESEKDDLKQISGVGPFLETKLNNLGIYTFEQVSQFDTELMQIVNDAIEFFPGRVQRDDWVGQAKKFHAEKNS